jgi:hypothetical protein
LAQRHWRIDPLVHIFCARKLHDFSLSRILANLDRSNNRFAAPQQVDDII